MSAYVIELNSEIVKGSAKAFAAEFTKAGKRPVLLKIDSPGGSVTEGHKLADIVRGHVPGVAVEIVGLAASMASIVAIAGSPVRIRESALFMLHLPWCETAGNAGELRKAADMLDAVTEPLVQAYMRKTGHSKEKVLGWMRAETWLNAREALRLKFVDQVLSTSKDGKSRVTTTIASARAVPVVRVDPVQAYRQALASGDTKRRQEIFARHKYTLLAELNKH